MPLAFMQRAGCYFPMAMMCPMSGHNLFVGPDGQWLGGYVPSSLRSYPFRLVRPKGSEQLALCVDEDSGVVKDVGEKGEPFFTAEGQLSQSTSRLLEFLRQIEANRMATELAVAALAEAGVIEPWPLEVEVGGKKAGIRGLQRVNELALGRQADETILKLHKTSALRLAYAQLMSM